MFSLWTSNVKGEISYLCPALSPIYLKLNADGHKDGCNTLSP